MSKSRFLETTRNFGLAASLAVLPTGAAAAPDLNHADVGRSKNVVERFWNETSLGRHFDNNIEAANPIFVENVATELGVDFLDATGKSKGYSDVIFEWAEQHPELGSVEELSALGGLFIIKTAQGFSVLGEENSGDLVVYDFETDDLQQVVGFIMQGIGITARAYFASVLNSALGAPLLEETWDAKVVKEVERSNRMPIGADGNRIDCLTHRDDPACQ